MKDVGEGKQTIAAARAADGGSASFTRGLVTPAARRRFMLCY